jgi:hypothetical protein
MVAGAFHLVSVLIVFVSTIISLLHYSFHRTTDACGTRSRPPSQYLRKSRLQSLSLLQSNPIPRNVLFALSEDQDVVFMILFRFSDKTRGTALPRILDVLCKITRVHLDRV